MPNPILTNISDADKRALRSGLSYTIAEFVYSPSNPSNASVSLLYQVNTKKLFSQPDSPRVLTPAEREALNKIHLELGFITKEIPILGPFETKLQELADQYLQILSDSGRTTPLVSETLYFWLHMLWPSVRTHIIAAAQRSQFGWAGSPYKISFWCPEGPPPPLEVDYVLPTPPTSNIPD